MAQESGLIFQCNLKVHPHWKYSSTFTEATSLIIMAEQSFFSFEQFSIKLAFFFFFKPFSTKLEANFWISDIIYCSMHSAPSQFFFFFLPFGKLALLFTPRQKAEGYCYWQYGICTYRIFIDDTNTAGCYSLMVMLHM